MDEVDWYSQVVLEGTSKCVLFEPHWLKPDICLHCKKNLLKHTREAVSKEEYIQAAVEYIDKKPSLILTVGDCSLFHGGYTSITNKKNITDNKVGFVVNTARGLEKVFGKKFIAAREYHEKNGVKFLDLGLLDMPEQKLAPEILEAAILFIHRALHVENKSVLVNCAQGKSRSAAIVVAYIMTFQSISYDDALAQVKVKRKMAQPNRGFAKQLKEWRKSDEYKTVAKKLEELLEI